MNKKIVDNKEGFLALRADWEALQEDAKDVRYYSTFQFLQQWYLHAVDANQIKLRVICVYDNTKLVGIAPLIIETRNYRFFKANALVFMGGIVDFLGFVVHKEVKSDTVLRTIFNVIYEELEWDVLDLIHIPTDTDLAYYCFKDTKMNGSFHLDTENPLIKTHNDFKAYESSFFRKKIRQYSNKLRREHDVNFNYHLGNSGNILERIKELHKERNDKLPDRSSMFNKKSVLNFYHSLFENNQNVITFCLETKDRIISYISAFQYNGYLHCWNMAFDSEYKSYSPGDLVYYEVIKYAFENFEEIRTVDFGAGGYFWKFRMTRDYCPSYKLNIINEISGKRKKIRLYNKAVKTLRTLSS